jgi:predicted O-linked N-acetylglucosamine transferase (SPINDLY family)
MESDPLLSLASDARSFGSCHSNAHAPPQRAAMPLSNGEVLAKAALHFKTALEVAKKQIQFSQELSLSLAEQSKKKDAQILAEQKTTQKLIQDKQELLLQLAESKEHILALESRVQSLEKSLELSRMATSGESEEAKLPNPNTNPPPLPPKSTSVKKSSRQKAPSEQVNRLDIVDTL